MINTHNAGRRESMQWLCNVHYSTKVVDRYILVTAENSYEKNGMSDVASVLPLDLLAATKSQQYSTPDIFLEHSDQSLSYWAMTYSAVFFFSTWK